MEAYKQVMSDPRTARKALDDWDAENPPGVRQKTLVEWGGMEEEVWNHGWRDTEAG